MTEESKEKMRRAKDPYRKITLYKLDQSKTILLTETEIIDELLADGWNYELTDEDREYNKLQGYKSASEKMKGKGNFMYPDGTFYGKIPLNDPIIDELGLVVHRTENQNKQCKEALTLGTVYNTGKKAYNNGEVEKNFVPGEEPEGWIAGGLKRKEYAPSSKTGSKVYNDGVKNYTVYEGEEPESHWVSGMLTKVEKRKPRREATTEEKLKFETKILMKRKVDLYFLNCKCKIYF
jgi:hypothetical protein